MLQAFIVIPFVVAMLLPGHHLPLPGFMREWIVAVSLVIAIFYGVRHKARVCLRMDSFVALTGLLAACAVVHGFTGMAAVPAMLISVGYLLLAFLAYQAGAGVDRERSAMIAGLASAATLAALYSCLCAAFQLSHLSLPFDLIYPPSVNGVYGNLAQANHFSDLLWLGLVSTLLLATERKVGRPLAWGVIFLLIVFSVLSTSRAAFIYATSVAVLPWLSGRSNKLAGMRWSGLIVFSMHLLIFGLFTKVRVAEFFGFNSLATRMSYLAETASGDARFGYWTSLLRNMHAWGSGVGNFKFEMLLHPEIWLDAGLERGGFEHAHNFFLDIGVEYGWIVMLVAVCMLVRWGWSRRNAIVDEQSLWTVSMLAIISVHAMLEYPLYYTYFMIPFCMLFGLLAPSGGTSRMVVLPGKVAKGLLLVFAGLLLVGYVQYQAISDVFFQFQFRPGNTQQDKYKAFAELDEIPFYSPYKPYASLIKAMLAGNEDIRRGMIKTDCDNVPRVWLSQASLVNCAASDQLFDASLRAERLMTAVCNMSKRQAKRAVSHFQEIVAMPVPEAVLAECSRIIVSTPAR